MAEKIRRYSVSSWEDIDEYEDAEGEYLKYEEVKHLLPEHEFFGSRQVRLINGFAILREFCALIGWTVLGLRFEEFHENGAHHYNNTDFWEDGVDVLAEFYSDRDVWDLTEFYHPKNKLIFMDTKQRDSDGRRIFEVNPN